MFENKKIFILGMARSGYSVAKLLAQTNTILITDMKDQEKEQVEELKRLGVNLIITDKPEELLDDTFDYVVKNPGIRKDHKCVVKAKNLKIPVINEVEVAYHFIPKETKIVGVTGSNGKTTTVTLIYEILKSANLNVHLGGNIGFPLSSIVKDIKKDDILVIEISDHQLVDMYDFKTDVSVFTNLVQAHLDFHDSYESYKKTKKKIFNNNTSSDLAILNKSDKDLMDSTKNIKNKCLYFSSKELADCRIEDYSIYYQEENIINLDDIRIKGIHNYENIMCAILVAKHFKVDNNIIRQEIKDFAGIEHRIEYVDKIKTREFYNDSKSTNIESTITALKSFKNNVILLMGGLDRNHSFEGLNNYLSGVSNVISYGETKNRIKEWATKQKVDATVVDNLKEAVKTAYNISEEKDVILLSPACASWDQFKDFEERGNAFKAYIEELKKENKYKK